ncbi:MAG: tRNA (guanine-N(1)-)-methyltransferase [Candidatus Shapirobacteria bacterium GW2011_GWE1_38_10]|uniref:tRNA (guanine-N(1)-)-methyltransferase n=1 Tax=Candidatus Shapirobacteria bacterium GW2011_GWE1_38_10 TaxID=1618488 RepID=A0A0G0KIU7_9BACT|nr:MAG: tRNA (guanine-N(1)-)-methyltransferase [Candidatus Shapirobacteria bacterium GW2011_GWF2_37_20]KKQ49094.1 MAG: tRNA (guanine-N(1)-)-methyltransferase [Candidatus Shapirobacteria bacterium GW2011_GWE1_38_10]KKQ64435.1 MAG: tRNA (guanine-N(1)-)-methyltransferase [Candidatus Shapirobacteria bacterium GW2011_GWF1_38_23]HBP51654.1 tRNA (guanosine(37)-N1)-methyltransferase TrmD [Candidatus Shapirobacteria bacterium]
MLKYIMKFDIITLFPEMFAGVFDVSIIGRAKEKGLVEINFHQMRKWAWNSYGAVDDRPYGGDVGMLIRVDVIDKALKEIKGEKSHIILTSARGKRFTQEDAKRLAKEKNLIIICGHYEGFDERISSLVDEEISIGDYVLTGGEIPAMVITDSVSRLLPGVLGKDESSQVESFSDPEKNIEFPQYTRPAEYNGQKVPEVLMSGDPKKIKEWQKKFTEKG